MKTHNIISNSVYFGLPEPNFPTLDSMFTKAIEASLFQLF